MPISAFLFGGRRATTVPLVYESRDWQHGVFVAATMGSEKTAAAFGGVGELRRDPFAMLPFCGYHMGDYFEHWLSMPERTDESKLPRIYGVNWFRKDADGKFLWPGYGENSRVLEWICRRLDGDADAIDTPIGAVPGPSDLVLDGLDDTTRGNVAHALRVDNVEWRRELPTIEEHFARFGDRLPDALRGAAEHSSRLADSPGRPRTALRATATIRGQDHGGGTAWQSAPTCSSRRKLDRPGTLQRLSARSAV